MSNEQPGTNLTNETTSGQTPTNPSLRTGLVKSILGFEVSEVIHVAAQLNLADILKDQSMTDEELAAATGCKPAALYRILRVLVSVDILTEVSVHRFALTEAGKLLQKDVPGSVYTMALHFSTPHVWQVWNNLLYSVQTGEVATKHIYGMTVWEYYQQHPEEGEVFYNFMSESSNQIAPAVSEKYNFDGVKVLADVGGAQGQILATVIKAHPHLKGILFDLPQVAEEAQENLAMEGVAERCQVVSGDMFKPWPVKADLFLMSRIIHDWHDEEVISILKNCRAAMDPDSKLVLLERVLPTDKDGALLFCLSDLNMLVGVGGQERNLEEYQNLFQAAGLRFTRTVPVTPAYSLIEAVVA